MERHTTGRPTARRRRSAVGERWSTPEMIWVKSAALRPT
jgi:hypothetical protein